MSGLFEFVLPAAVLFAGAFLIYLVSRVFRLSNRVEAVLTVVILIATGVLLILQLQGMPGLLQNPEAVFGADPPGGIVFVPNAVGTFILILGTAIGILVSVYSGEYLSRDSRYLHYYPLILLTLMGLMGMFMSVNLFNLFFLTELVTVSVSALIAFRYRREISIKAGFKYLIMSSLGTMIMLLGIYFVYRSTGDLNLTGVLARPDDLTRIGAACFLLGFSLKAGVFPLHTWVPDVYGHAPSAVSGLLAGVVSKSMLFVMPVICLRLGMTERELGIYLMVFACFNMLVGSIRMLRQRLLRRFLSFSSIAQTGYLMFGLGIGFYYQLDQAFSAGLYLFLVIAVMKSLAFLAAGIFQHHTGTQDMEALTGIGGILTMPALCFSVALAGLAGIPLLAGFTGKWLIFTAALATGDIFAIITLVIFLISTLIGLGGYLPTLVRQYLPLTESQLAAKILNNPVKSPGWMLAPVILLALLVVGIGTYPAPWINLVEQVMKWMLI